MCISALFATMNALASGVTGNTYLTSQVIWAHASCDESFAAVRRAFLTEAERAGFVVRFQPYCGQNETGSESENHLELAIEPATAEQIPDFERYLSAHQDLPVLGQVIHFTRVNQIYNRVMVSTLELTGEWPQVEKRTLTEIERHRVWMNLADFNVARQAAERAGYYDDPRDFLQLVNDLFGPRTMEAYRTHLLAAANGVAVLFSYDYLLADLTLVEGVSIDTFLKDCRFVGEGQPNDPQRKCLPIQRGR
jgi:hypothetical protein